VVELDEQHLRRCSRDFAEYAQRVPKLFPSAAAPRRKHFRFSLYRHNRDYEASLGFLAGTAALLWKALR